MQFLQWYISQLTVVITQPDFCNELLITVNHFSVYSYCFNYIWRHLKCTAQTLQGVSSPAKCPPILCLWWNHTELIISVNGCSHNHRCAYTHIREAVRAFASFRSSPDHKQDHQRPILVFSFLQLVLNHIASLLSEWCYRITATEWSVWPLWYPQHTPLLQLCSLDS